MLMQHDITVKTHSSLFPQYSDRVVYLILGSLGSVSSPLYVCETRKRYVVKHNLITEVYLITMMETTTCFGLLYLILEEVMVL